MLDEQIKRELRGTKWMDIEDIENDVQRYLHCDSVECSIQRECIYITYNPDLMPTNRDVIGLIHYVLWDLGGKVVFDLENNLVRVRFRVKTG